MVMIRTKQVPRVISIAIEAWRMDLGAYNFFHPTAWRCTSPSPNPLANGQDYRAENEMSSLNPSESEQEEREEEEEEERRRAESDSAIRRAFQDDESRRTLTAENAVRVMEAKRGVSIGGSAPDWIRGVPEDRWIDQLRRLRQSPHSSA
ncbi:hypothetical protein Nepgr_000039 [Nepenthes gracilis]|uniref:Uncharacterized protein n=1 Tax=Nepenthes gracilis TaxID=150966 RepID=A0AAD3P1F7_NEPGR|nr:hypothetical protein Nepgr_000039 [Nepenthes gracilis]